MSERLVVDSIMTADGEVVPLGLADKDGKCKLSDADCCVSWMISNIRGRIKRLCAGDGERDRREK